MLDKLNQLTESHGELKAGRGMVSGVIALSLAILCFHHWHHSQDGEAIDKNYAAHFAFIDHLLGTAAQSDRKWPERYGVQGDYMPNSFWQQLKFPFVWKG